MNSGKPRGEKLHDGDMISFELWAGVHFKKVSLAPDLGCFSPLLSSSATSSLIADPTGARQSLPAHLEHTARVVLLPAKPVNKYVLQEVLQKMYFRNLKGVASVLSECL